jgi:hypothetical protein
VRGRAETEITLSYLSAGSRAGTSGEEGKSGRALTKWKRNGRARPNLNPKLSREDPKTADAKPDQQPTDAGTPSGPPQSPELRNTDA